MTGLTHLTGFPPATEPALLAIGCSPQGRPECCFFWRHSGHCSMPLASSPTHQALWSCRCTWGWVEPAKSADLSEFLPGNLNIRKKVPAALCPQLHCSSSNFCSVQFPSNHPLTGALFHLQRSIFLIFYLTKHSPPCSAYSIGSQFLRTNAIMVFNFSFFNF